MTDMKSYESCNWLIKTWRCRWYAFAYILYGFNYVSLNLWIGYFLDGAEFGSKTKENFRKSLKDIKKHIELTIMAKYCK